MKRNWSGDGTQSSGSAAAAEPEKRQGHGFPFDRLWLLTSRCFSDDHLYGLYNVDVNSVDKPVGPLLVFDNSCNYHVGCAVLDSKFYIFGGLVPTVMSWSKETFVLDLKDVSPSSSPPIMSKESLSLKRGPDMSHRKIFPSATLIKVRDRTKICVFSHTPRRYIKYFELFDPDKMSWSKVPNPFEVPYRGDGEQCRIEACHTEKSCLYISTTLGTNYIIDFADENPQWKLSGMPPFPDDSCMQVDRQIFAPLGFFTKTLSPLDDPLHQDGVWIALLGGRVYFCAFGYTTDGTIAPHLSVEILDCDSNSFGKFLSDWHVGKNLFTPKSFSVELNCSLDLSPYAMCGGYW